MLVVVGLACQRAPSGGLDHLAALGASPRVERPTEAAWAELAAIADAGARRARAAVAPDSADEAPTFRGRLERHPVPLTELSLEGGSCYVFSFAWPSGPAMAYVSIGPHEEGLSRLSKSERLRAPGTVTFCADGPGKVTVSASYLNEHGVMSNAPQYFALSVVAYPETGEARAARHSVEDEQLAKAEAHARGREHNRAVEQCEALRCQPSPNPAGLERYLRCQESHRRCMARLHD